MNHGIQKLTTPSSDTHVRYDKAASGKESKNVCLHRAAAISNDASAERLVPHGKEKGLDAGS